MASTERIPPDPERVAAFQTGVSAEARAAAFLTEQGYRILAQRFHTRQGEIDLIAAKRGLVAFVEVKARARLDDAAYAVTPRQQQRIIAAARSCSAAMRLPDSNSTKVAPIRANSPARARRAPCFDGKKPSKKN